VLQRTEAFDLVAGPEVRIDLYTGSAEHRDFGDHYLVLP
jgi:hypothetical protein